MATAKQRYEPDSIHEVGDEAISLLKALGKLSEDKKRKTDAVIKAGEIIAQRNEEVRPLLIKVRDHIAKSGEVNGCNTWEAWATHAGWTKRNLNYIVNGRKSRKDGNPGSRKVVFLRDKMIINVKSLPNSRKLATTEYEIVRIQKHGVSLKCVDEKQNIWALQIRVRPVKAGARKLRKREECPECGYTLDVKDGKFGKHTHMPGPRYRQACAMSCQPVTVDEGGKIVNTAKAKAAAA